VTLLDIEGRGMIYRWLFPLLWLVFIAVWIAMARGVKTVAQGVMPITVGIGLTP
jgi:hypothetical protein